MMPSTSPTEPARKSDAAERLAVIRVRLEVGDLAIGLVLLIVAAWFWLEAGGIEDYSDTGVGAADFPRGLAALLALGVVTLLVTAGWRIATQQAEHMIVVERYGHVLVGMGLLIAFPVLMSWLGYYLAMTIWLPAFLWLADCRRPLLILIYVSGILLFTKIVFESILGTTLP